MLKAEECFDVFAVTKSKIRLTATYHYECRRRKVAGICKFYFILFYYSRNLTSTSLSRAPAISTNPNYFWIPLSQFEIAEFYCSVVKSLGSVLKKPYLISYHSAGTRRPGNRGRTQLHRVSWRRRWLMSSLRGYHAL